MHSSKAIYVYVTARGWETGYYNFQKVSFVKTLLDLRPRPRRSGVNPQFLANQDAGTCVVPYTKFVEIRNGKVRERGWVSSCCPDWKSLNLMNNFME